MPRAQTPRRQRPVWPGPQIGIVVDGIADEAVDEITCGDVGQDCDVPEGMFRGYLAKSDCEDCGAFLVAESKSLAVVSAKTGGALKRYAAPSEDWWRLGRRLANDFKPGSALYAALEGGTDAPAALVAEKEDRPAPAQAAPRGETLTKEDVAAIVSQAVKSAARDQKKEAAVSVEPASDVDTPAYQENERPDDYAVVVGVEKYPDLPEAQFAERDAKAFRDHLLALGVPERNIIYLTNARASRAGIAKNLDLWLPNHVAKNSTVYFYYSGHGAPDASTKQAYLVPSDGDPQYLSETGYPVKTLYEKLSALKAKRVIVALDACFSGAGGRSVLPAGTRPLVTKVDAGASAAGRNLVALSASASEEISGVSKDQGHGVFTYYLLKGLNGAAARADGRVTVKALYDYLRPKVQDAARRDNRSQTPQLLGGAEVVLR